MFFRYRTLKATNKYSTLASPIRIRWLLLRIRFVGKKKAATIATAFNIYTFAVYLE